MPTQYDDIYFRDNFDDDGTVPSRGYPYWSPDIIPVRNATLTWTQISSTYNSGTDIGKDIINGGVNNIYVRAKNLNTTNTSSGTVALYYSKASLLMLPTRWIPISTPPGQNTAPLVDGNQKPTIAAKGICVGNPPFLLQNLPPNPGDHYCLVGVVNTPTHPVTIPQSFADNVAFVQWVQNSPSVGFRNLNVVPNNQTQLIRGFTFGSTNPTSAYFYFRIVAQKFQTGTGIVAQCSDASSPINFSGSLPAPDGDGNQITGFEQRLPANFTSTLLVTATSPGGPFPDGAKLHIEYHQIPPQQRDPREMEVGRFVTIARVHEHVGNVASTEFLIKLGECTLLVES
jgi:hypothetical protein